MEIKVLGPVEARVNGRSATPTAAKPRQILALLALRAGHVVSVPSLMEELWGDRPPRSARTTLQTYILQLRKLIEGASSGDAKEVLVTRFGGYLLDIAPECVDVNEFVRLAQAGHNAAEARDFASASRLLRSALAMWRGSALADIRPGLPLSAEVVRLEETWLNAVSARIDADLQLGRHHALSGELAGLGAQFPMNENLCELHMVALVRSGRQWQALDVYRSLRETLIRELGVDPSARLQQLQYAILNSYPRLDSPRTRAPETLLA